MSILPAVAEEQSEALADDDASRDVSRQVGEPLATLHAITPLPSGPRDRAEFADLGHPELVLARTEVLNAHPLVDDGRLTGLVAGGRGRRTADRARRCANAARRLREAPSGATTPDVPVGRWSGA